MLQKSSRLQSKGFSKPKERARDYEADKAARTAAMRQALCTPARTLHTATMVGGTVLPKAAGKGKPQAKVRHDIRQSAKGRKRASTAESDHMGRVKRLACVLCDAIGLQQESPTDVHHLREGQGGAQRASHWLTVALCHDGCHQGPHGIHGDRARLRQANCTELELLAWTLEALNKEGETY